MYERHELFQCFVLFTLVSLVRILAPQPPKVRIARFEIRRSFARARDYDITLYNFV